MRRHGGATGGIASQKSASVIVLVLMALGIPAPLGATNQPLARQPDCSLGAETEASLATYEWRREAWRTPAARAELAASARRLCLDRVYVDLTGTATASRLRRAIIAAELAALAETATANGFELGAVAGDPWWPSPLGRQDVVQVLDFISGLRSDAISITALHLDVEPWGLDEWAVEKGALTQRYLGFVAHLEAQRTEIDPTLPVAYLVPYWFEGSNGEAPEVAYGGETAFPYRHLSTILRDGASTVIMAYRNEALGHNGIVAVAREEFAQASPPAQLALETAPVQPSSVTFAGTCLKALDREIRLATEYLNAREVVINDAKSLFDLGTSSTASDC